MYWNLTVALLCLCNFVMMYWCWLDTRSCPLKPVRYYVWFFYFI